MNLKIIFITYFIFLLGCSKTDFNKGYNLELNSEDSRKQNNQIKTEELPIAEEPFSQDSSKTPVNSSNTPEVISNTAKDSNVIVKTRLVCHWPLSESKKTISISSLSSKNSCKFLSFGDFISQINETTLALDIEDLKIEKNNITLKIEIECQNENQEVEKSLIDVFIPKNMDDEKARELCLNNANSKGKVKPEKTKSN